MRCPSTAETIRPTRHGMTWTVPRRSPYPFVERFRDRRGKLRHYFRRGKGARTALPGLPGSAEFDEAYQSALAGATAARKPKEPRHAAGTIGALVVSYKGSLAYAKLRATTKKGYVTRLETLLTTHGHRTVAGLNRDRIER